jgi:environmental stress-induced protein Ves
VNLLRELCIRHSVEFPKVRVIRKSSFTATPWKNGGGITHEAIRVPASGDPFRWRVSVAHIDASGPFSDFAAYNRKMVLLRGAGIELRFANGERRSLRHAGELVEFDGALSTYCELLDGPCVDLNLMVSKSDRVAVRVERVDEPLAVSASLDESVLVFPIDRGITLDIDSDDTVMLEPWDLAILSQCRGRLSRLETVNASTSTAVFLATLANKNS